MKSTGQLLAFDHLCDGNHGEQQWRSAHSGGNGVPALLIWMVLGLIAVVAIGIVIAIIKDDKKQKKKADLEARGARQRKMDVLRSKISAVTKKL